MRSQSWDIAQYPEIAIQTNCTILGGSRVAYTNKPNTIQHYILPCYTNKPNTIQNYIIPCYTNKSNTIQHYILLVNVLY